MRKRLVRNGLSFVLFSLALIIVVSFFHRDLAVLLSLSVNAEQGLYGKGIFSGAAIGGYGVVVTVLGLLLSSDRRDIGVKVLPVIFLLICSVVLFFYLLVTSFNNPRNQQTMPPDTSITI